MLHFSLANEFLKTLASENRGRYHCVEQRQANDGGFDVHRFAHQLIESDFESPEVSSVLILARFIVLMITNGISEDCVVHMKL